MAGEESGPPASTLATGEGDGAKTTPDIAPAVAVAVRPTRGLSVAAAAAAVGTPRRSARDWWDGDP
jgi:hypothetical protein